MPPSPAKGRGGRVGFNNGRRCGEVRTLRNLTCRCGVGPSLTFFAEASSCGVGLRHSRGPQLRKHPQASAAFMAEAVSLPAKRGTEETFAIVLARGGAASGESGCAPPMRPLHAKGGGRVSFNHGHRRREVRRLRNLMCRCGVGPSLTLFAEASSCGVGLRHSRSPRGGVSTA